MSSLFQVHPIYLSPYRKCRSFQKYPGWITPYSCLLVVVVDHYAALQPQLWLELELNWELELGVELLKQQKHQKQLELLELVEHLCGAVQDTQKALGL